MDNVDGFVINRYGVENEENSGKNDEQERLNKLLDKVEKNKLKRALQRQKKHDEKALKRLNTKKKKKQLRGEKVDGEIFPVVENGRIDDEEEEQEKGDNDKNITDKQNSELNGFEILSGKTKKKTKVKRILPKWLREPTIIKTNLKLNSTKINGLDKFFKSKLKENGVRHFFPVQAEVIPYVLKCNENADVILPRDVCVSAPTGSGKTLAFVLPIVQALRKHSVKKIRALVILPTQDLATQVFQCFKTYTQDTNLTTLLITGNTSFAMEQKQLVYENIAFGFVSKVDILVCTAGRLVDHLKGTKGFCLRSLEFLVIDEADRVLDSLQHDWLYHLEKHIYHEDNPGVQILNLRTLQQCRPPQKLLFSATLSQDPEKLSKLNLFQPKLFTSIVENGIDDENEVESSSKLESFVGKYTTPSELTEKYIVCSLDLKPLVLYEFLKREKLTKTIVFAHSVDAVHRLAILLRGLFGEEMKIEEISSTLDMKSRNTIINQFADGHIDVLVCTDSLARGIDLPCVQCVISYSAPKHVKTYIHRAGRTARAGQEGLAVTMLHQQQLNKFQELLKQGGKNNLQEVKINEEELEELANQYQEALEKLRDTIMQEKKGKKYLSIKT